jgi:phospholipase/carboxylesterase
VGPASQTKRLFFKKMNPTTHETVHLGAALSEATGAVILLHGRGSTAHDIAGLARALKNPALAFLAPNAPGNTWYPQRFLSPLSENEPHLSQALQVIGALVQKCLAAGLPPERIGLAGFSQGACLSLEYAMRHAGRLGFVAGLSGALIGPLDTPRPAVDLQGTPVLLACAEADAHIPLPYVESSAAVFERCGAAVTQHIFRGASHSVFPEEIEWLRARVSGWKTPAVR